VTQKVSVRVPPSAVPILIKFASLRVEERTMLLNHLARVDPITSMSGMRRTLHEGAPGLSDDEVRALVAHLLSLSTFAASNDYDLPEVVTSVARSEDVRLPEGQVESFVADVCALLNEPAVAGFVRAIDVASEFGRAFSNARFLSDIRPVFAKDGVEKPAGALIAHTMKIEYYTDGKFRTSTFTLSSADLNTLGEAIQRARGKEAELHGLLNRLELVEFRVDDESAGE